MAENEPQEQTTEPSGGKKSKMKLILIPVVLIFLVVLVVGGAKMGFLPIPGLAPKQEESEKEKEAEPQQPESSMGFNYPMKPFIVNLADQSGGRYLKVRFDLELDSKNLVPEVEQRLAQLTDSVIMLLSSKTYKDLASYEGKDRMRREIILRLNSFLTTGSIRKIYFTEFVMQ